MPPTHVSLAPAPRGPSRRRPAPPVGPDGAHRRATVARDEEVREAVLAVVADALRARPYDQVTYTFVARLARVTTAEVRRCFPTKAEMVLTALRTPPARPAGRATLELSGAEIVSRHLEFWEAGDNAVILRNLYTASAGDRRLAATIEAHTIAALIAPFAARVKTTDACPRARLAVSELLGLAVSRYVLHQEPLASADHETIAAWAGPSLDYFLKGELGRTAGTAAPGPGPSGRRATWRAVPASGAPPCAG